MNSHSDALLTQRSHDMRPRYEEVQKALTPSIHLMIQMIPDHDALHFSHERLRIFAAFQCSFIYGRDRNLERCMYVVFEFENQKIRGQFVPQELHQWGSQQSYTFIFSLIRLLVHQLWHHFRQTDRMHFYFAQMPSSVFNEVVRVQVLCKGLTLKDRCYLWYTTRSILIWLARQMVQT